MPPPCRLAYLANHLFAEVSAAMSRAFPCARHWQAGSVDQAGGCPES